ncbi:PilZ domain-containing protein [Shewanella maritima]|uniref:PilZ domain-containing protein n=1 Tax=Shewanella maritima TaxID=2520507 RepID=A0A411PF58_9GAMM|nr:PilZ domain-containing protein [Shewanella maritima]QBF82191.1 PilZ domain-containing protein [Shewanella maritima]
MSLDNHSELIEQLKPLMMEPDFADIFEQLTAGESNSSRFLIKMELNRITAACTRIIDLRDKSELPCEEVTIAEQRHFLDEPAKEALLSALPLYRNKYTLGVYEHVIESHRQRRAKARDTVNEAESPTNQFLVPGVVLGSYFHRSEERMNYSIKIEASQANGAKTFGATLDLSVGGARVKLPIKHRFDQDEPLKVKLLDLNEEFFFEDLQHGVDYQIVNIENKDNNAIFRLKRVGGGKELDQVITQLIRGYKFRYKVDINDVNVTAKGLGHERHYLPLQPHLPLFIAMVNGRPQITHELLARGNQPLQHYFSDENNVSQLPELLTFKRLVNLVKQPTNPDHHLMFCFTHNANGQLRFYSATLAELKEHDSLPLFLGFSASKASWRVFKVTVQKIDHSKNYKTSTLPGEDQRYASLTETELAKFTHVLQLIDLTNEDIKAQYKQWFNNDNVNKLKVFTQKKVAKDTIRKVSMPFSERRREARFAFKTLVHVLQNGKKAVGITHDISSRGLQVYLDEPIDFQFPAEVQLSFPRLQTMAGKTDLSNQPYQLLRARQNGQILHLSANIGHSTHNGVEFLNKLIVHNKEKLAQLSDTQGEQKELADGMKNLAMRQLVGVPYFIEKTAKNLQMGCLGVGTKPDEISHLFAQNADKVLQYDMTPLLDNGVLKEHILDPIKAMKPTHDMDFFEVFIQLTKHARGNIHLVCQVVSEFESSESQALFIKQSKSTGKFMALRVYRGATGKPDMKYIRRELEFINVHAPHRAKQLEEQLWRVVGTGELIDITAEVELRFPELNQ